MLLRDYLPEDYPQLLELWKELDMSAVERGDTPEVIQKTISLGGKLILMLEPETGLIVGSSWMTTDGRRIFLHHFGIKKEHQRNGLGLMLAIESLRFIREMRMQVKLEVHKDNLPAKRLYEKVGFSAFTEYDIYMIRKPSEIDPEKSY